MSYSDVSGHHSMVFDGLRNAAYARAMRQAIKPGTTVMDLGAGLGVHGLQAALLGAAQVHLVEPAPVLEVARQVAAANGLANVHCHNCRAEELQLDDRVDVLVSVFTGNFLLTEDLLPSLFHARDRFLSHGGTLIPDVVFFGGAVPAARVQQCQAAVAAADALLAVGSSLQVYSGFRFCRLASQLGKPLAIINPGITRADSMAALKCHTECESLLAALAARL